jgi:acyl-coenzyme A thioesterase PaaI-like protein
VSQGGFKGFIDEGGGRPWRSAELPGGSAEYGGAYGELTDTLSDFLDRLAEAHPDLDLVAALTTDLEIWARKLEPLAVPERRRVFGRRTDLPGRGQVMSPKIVLTDSEQDSVEGTVRFGPYYLGGNGAAHGGTIPLMFDEVLGRLANSGGRPSQRTAYLHTDFRSITPIGKTLQLRAWVVSTEGRKRILRATLHDGNTLCAEAEGLFVALKPGQP